MPTDLDTSYAAQRRQLAARARPTPRPSNNMNFARNALDYTSYAPSDPRSPHQFTIQGGPAFRQLQSQDPRGYVDEYQYWRSGAGGYPVNQPSFYPNMGGGGGRGGGGGGGGGGAGGLDQGTFDWLMAQLQNRPGEIGYRAYDAPDPSQFMRWDNSLYGQARQGVQQGIAGVRSRADTAYDAAGRELAQYRNPYGQGLQQVNPDMRAQMAAMARYNNAEPQLQASYEEGVQGDRAMSNVMALLAGTDQARQAANKRALAGDRRTTEQNLGIEGNMLNLGVNMAEARGKTAFDQALQQAMLAAAQQEAQTNWSRQNEVETTNVAARNAWLQNTLEQILGLVGSKAAGTKLPGDMSWLSAVAPGINVQAGSVPRPPVGA